MANFYQKLNEYYRDLRFKAQSEAAENLARARKNERFKEIDNRLSDIEREQAFAEIANDNKKAEELEKEKQGLNAEADKILKSMHLTRRALSPVYACEKCGDTGFMGSKPCSCYKTALKKIAVGTVGVNLTDTPAVKESELTGENKVKAYRLMQKFADKFPDAKRKNFIFLGTTGTGKTMLQRFVFIFLRTEQHLFGIPFPLRRRP